MSIEDEYSLVRLFDTSAEFIINHLDRLNEQDRYLRFGQIPSRETITKYVNESLAAINTRTHADFWFGIKKGVELVATLHVSIRDDVAEFAFSTAEDHRGKKLGQLLFARGYQLVTEYSITRIYMMCLSSNAAIKHIARKFGLAVMTHGSESEGSVNIQYPVSLSKVHEIKMCIIDHGLFDPNPSL